jgi:hypothetical protein
MATSRAGAGAASGGAAAVAKNAKGGVLVLEEDIAAAFKMLNRRGAGAGGGGGRVSLAALAERLAALQPGATRDDAERLLGEDPKSGLTSKLLSDLLLDNTISSFDPAAAAFRALDPQGRGYIDFEALKAMWAGLGFTEALTHDDMALLAAAAGSQSGRVSFKDWAEKILPLTRSRKPTRAELARPPEDD